MQDAVVHKAGDLGAEVRRAFESLLGRPLADDETVSVRASRGRMVQDAPTGRAREEAFGRLMRRLHEIDLRVADLPGDEAEALIDEALADARRRK